MTTLVSATARIRSALRTDGMDLGFDFLVGQRSQRQGGKAVDRLEEAVDAGEAKLLPQENLQSHVIEQPVVLGLPSETVRKV